jgi:ubiquinone/menaquinone biosynthesis C-methylase UbiE
MTMPYFTDPAARAIIRTTYEVATGEDDAVATTLYDPMELAGLPRDAVHRAFGVGHPVRHAALRPGEVVLDVGCGAGIDTLLAARQVTRAGRVLALDMTPAMVDRARANARAAGFEYVEVHEGLMEALPFSDATIDVVIANGVLNLSTRPSRSLAEMHRVLRPGGRVALADLVLPEALPEEIRKNATALAA